MPTETEPTARDLISEYWRQRHEADVKLLAWHRERKSLLEQKLDAQDAELQRMAADVTTAKNGRIADSAAARLQQEADEARIAELERQLAAIHKALTNAYIDLQEGQPGWSIEYHWLMERLAEAERIEQAEADLNGAEAALVELSRDSAAARLQQEADEERIAKLNADWEAMTAEADRERQRAEAAERTIAVDTEMIAALRQDKSAWYERAVALEAELAEARRLIAMAENTIGNFKVPQDMVDAAMQVRITVGPTYEALRDYLAAHPMPESGCYGTPQDRVTGPRTLIWRKTEPAKQEREAATEDASKLPPESKEAPPPAAYKPRWPHPDPEAVLVGHDEHAEYWAKRDDVGEVFCDWTEHEYEESCWKPADTYDSITDERETAARLALEWAAKQEPADPHAGRHVGGTPYHTALHSAEERQKQEQPVPKTEPDYETEAPCPDRRTPPSNEPAAPPMESPATERRMFNLATKVERLITTYSYLAGFEGVTECFQEAMGEINELRAQLADRLGALERRLDEIESRDCEDDK